MSPKEFNICDYIFIDALSVLGTFDYYLSLLFLLSSSDYYLSLLFLLSSSELVLEEKIEYNDLLKDVSPKNDKCKIKVNNYVWNIDFLVNIKDV